MNCKCCNKLLPTGHAHPRKRPAQYCDGICFAADHTLSRAGIAIWRTACWRLNLRLTRPVS